MQSHLDLKVWQRGYDLVLRTYGLTERFPRSERHGLVPQLRRAAVSVIGNIAEGSKRRHPQDYGRLLNIAEASLSECDSLLRVSLGLGFVSSEEADPVLDEMDQLARMLATLRRKVISRS